MNNVSNKEDLKSIGLFSDLTEEEFDVLSDVMERRIFSSGEDIFKEGEQGQTLYVIKKGEVEIHKRDPSGQKHTITMLEDDAIFGELSFISGKPHSAMISAVTDTETYLLSMDDFEKILPEYPYLVFKIMKYIVLNIRTVVGGMNRKHLEMMDYMWGRTR